MFYISEILKANHSLTKLIISIVFEYVFLKKLRLIFSLNCKGLNKDLSEIEHLPNALQNNSTLKVLEMGCMILKIIIIKILFCFFLKKLFFFFFSKFYNLVNNLKCFPML